MRKRVIVVVLVVCLLLTVAVGLSARVRVGLRGTDLVIKRHEIALYGPMLPRAMDRFGRRIGSACQFEVSLSLERGFEIGKPCWDGNGTAIYHR